MVIEGAHAYRYTLATALLEKGWTREDVSDVLRGTPEIIPKHYAQWTARRQECISSMMQDLWDVTFLSDSKSLSVTAVYNKG